VGTKVKNQGEGRMKVQDCSREKRDVKKKLKIKEGERGEKKERMEWP